MFKCGETDGGRKLKVTLKEYIEYALYNRDDSPLYMFEACLEEHPEAKVMMNDYRPPTILSEDLFTELVSLNPTLTFSLAKVVPRPIVGS
jgi:histone arginine demethylase JMJD6